jgi:hypothetical protein
MNCYGNAYQADKYATRQTLSRFKGKDEMIIKE